MKIYPSHVYQKAAAVLANDKNYVNKIAHFLLKHSETFENFLRQAKEFLNAPSIAYSLPWAIGIDSCTRKMIRHQKFRIFFQDKDNFKKFFYLGIISKALALQPDALPKEYSALYTLITKANKENEFKNKYTGLDVSSTFHGLDDGKENNTSYSYLFYLLEAIPQNNIFIIDNYYGLGDAKTSILSMYEEYSDYIKMFNHNIDEDFSNALNEAFEQEKNTNWKDESSMEISGWFYNETYESNKWEEYFDRYKEFEIICKNGQKIQDESTADLTLTCAFLDGNVVHYNLDPKHLMEILDKTTDLDKKKYEAIKILLNQVKEYHLNKAPDKEENLEMEEWGRTLFARLKHLEYAAQKEFHYKTGFIHKDQTPRLKNYLKKYATPELISEIIDKSSNHKLDPYCDEEFERLKITLYALSKNIKFSQGRVNIYTCVLERYKGFCAHREDDCKQLTPLLLAATEVLYAKCNDNLKKFHYENTRSHELDQELLKAVLAKNTEELIEYIVIEPISAISNNLLENVVPKLKSDDVNEISQGLEELHNIPTKLSSLERSTTLDKALDDVKNMIRLAIETLSVSIDGIKDNALYHEKLKELEDKKVELESKQKFYNSLKVEVKQQVHYEIVYKESLGPLANLKYILLLKEPAYDKMSSIKSRYYLKINNQNIDLSQDPANLAGTLKNISDTLQSNAAFKEHCNKARTAFLHAHSHVQNNSKKINAWNSKEKINYCSYNDIAKRITDSNPVLQKRYIKTICALYIADSDEEINKIANSQEIGDIDLNALIARYDSLNNPESAKKPQMQNDVETKNAEQDKKAALEKEKAIAEAKRVEEKRAELVKNAKLEKEKVEADKKAEQDKAELERQNNINAEARNVEREKAELPKKHDLEKEQNKASRKAKHEKLADKKAELYKTAAKEKQQNTNADKSQEAKEPNENNRNGQGKPEVDGTQNKFDYTKEIVAGLGTGVILSTVAAIKYRTTTSLYNIIKYNPAKTLLSNLTDKLKILKLPSGIIMASLAAAAAAHKLKT